MRSKKLIGQVHIESALVVLIIAIILLVAGQRVFGQIRIGGIKIDGIKGPGVTKGGPATSKPEPVRGGGNPEAEQRGDDPTSSFIAGLVYNITETRSEVEGYTPEGKIYLVSTPKEPWLVRAVSAKAREAYAVEKKFNDWRKGDPKNKYDAELDTLAAAAAKKLPLYLPKASFFAIRDAALEKLIKGTFKTADPAKIQVLKIGLLHANWQIEKNGLGLPVNRYREAFIWARNTDDDHPYCHLYGFVVQQDYAGGGTYSATRVYQNTDALHGCPVK